MWTSLEIAKLIASLLIPVAIALIGYFLNLRLKQIDQINKTRLRQEREAREQEQAELERRYKHRIEFSLNAAVIGVQKGYYLVEFTVTINNKSLVKKDFTAIPLMVRGIEKESDIELWSASKKNKTTKEVIKTKQTSRIYFPEEILNENILPPFWSNIFVEPGVRQDITFTTPIPENISYILATAKFSYKGVPKSHTTEKMFALKTPEIETAHQ